VLCAGWGLVFGTTLEWSANISNETCGTFPECRGSSLIPNAAVQVRMADTNGGTALAWQPSVAISGDGNKVAYLDALRPGLAMPRAARPCGRTASSGTVQKAGGS
jgi:hypothetical protein